MILLKEAVNEQAAAKVGIFGDPGSGKTTTAGLLGLGISLTYYKGAPVAIMDTEKASDFLIPIYKAEGVKLLTHKSKAFQDMMKVLSEAETTGCCVFIVDSVSHTWDELVNSYCHKMHISRPEFHHWKDIKAPWHDWTDRYLTSSLHCIVNGRLGYEYEYQGTGETRRDGKEKMELIKGESKMRAEGQFGYEPHLLVEMERVREVVGGPGGGQKHIAHVLKDRSWFLNGKSLIFESKPRYEKGMWKEVFQAFEPHFSALNIGGVQQTVNPSNSEDIFNENGRDKYSQRDKERAICLEDIVATMQLLWPGQTADQKNIRIRVIESLWGTRAWSAVENMPLEKVQDGLKVLRAYEQNSTPENPIQGIELAKKTVAESLHRTAAVPSLFLIEQKDGSFFVSGTTAIQQYGLESYIKVVAKGVWHGPDQGFRISAEAIPELEKIAAEMGCPIHRQPIKKSGAAHAK